MRDEEKNTNTNGSKVQKYLRKRWVFPAVYIASAAVILTGVLWFQSSGDSNVEAPGDEFSYEVPNENEQGNDFTVEQEAIEVTSTTETVQMPVYDDEGIHIQKQYYDYSASSEDQEAALVFYNNTYYPNTGVDYAMESGESFDVIASLSGTVVQSEKDSLLGNVVKIEHEDGITTHYSSLKDVHVENGQVIDQGTVIGTAGQNEYNKDAGVHVHFEIRKDNEPVNPIDFIDQPLSSLVEYDASEENNTESVTEEKEAAQEDQETIGEEGITDEQGSEEQDAKQSEDETEEGTDGTESDTQIEDASVSMTRA